MKFTVARSGVPAGSYGAKFVQAEAFSNDYGDAVRLTFEVVAGDHTGATCSRIVSPKLTPKSGLYRFVQALAGRKPEAGEEIDLAALYGTSGMIVVQETDSGAVRVESFVRMG